MDQFDEKIVNILQREGRLPVTELAKRVGISKTPCQVRLRKLQEQGFILGFSAQVNYAKLNREHIAFVEVTLSDTKEAALQAFNQAVNTLENVEECHMIASSFDYLLKVRTSDIVEYRKLLGESISSLPYVASTSTYVSMQSVKEANHPVSEF